MLFGSKEESNKTFEKNIKIKINFVKSKIA